MSPFNRQRQSSPGRKILGFPQEFAIGSFKGIVRSIFRLPRFFLMSIVRAYRFTLSPDHSFWARALDRPPYCQHFPSCSSYGLESLEKHGAIRGSFYAIRRVLSCNPWSKWGYDPVPVPKSPRSAPIPKEIVLTQVSFRGSHPTKFRKERFSSHHSDSHA